MKKSRPNPARDAFRKTMKETNWSRGLFGDGISLDLHAARSGDTEAIVNRFRSGGELSDEDREWLADAANGVAKIERRKLDQRIMEWKIVHLVLQYRAQGMTEYAAMEAVLDNHAELGVTSSETLKTYLRNWKKSR